MAVKIVNDYADKLEDRYATVYNTVKNADGTYERKVSKIVLRFSLKAGRPFMTIDDAELSRFVYKTVNTPVPVKLGNVDYETFICDEVYEKRNANKKRFIRVGDVINPIMSSGGMVVYDRKFSDFLFISEISFFRNSDSMIVKDNLIDMVGTILNITNIDDNDKFINEGNLVTAQTHMELPDGIENSITTTLLVTLQGTDPDSAYRDTNLFEQTGSNQTFIMRGETRPRVLIKLGKVSDFITDTSDVYVAPYQVYGYSPVQHKTFNIGLIKPGDRNLYIEYGM